jgi:transporter family protein
MKWILIALLGAVCYALYNISIKKGSSSIHPILGGVILQFVAALLGSTLLGARFLDRSTDKIHYDRKGLLWSVGAGLWVGTAEIVSFVVSGMGVPATSSIPIIIGGSVVFGSILGVLLLGEVVMCHGWSGVVMVCIGIAMVAADPGEKLEEGGGGEGGELIMGEPPLLIWIGPALFCALAYALYNICIKLGSASINPILGAVVLQLVAAIFGSCILGLLVLVQGVQPELDSDGVIWACWAGIFVGGAELLSFCVSGLGVPASQSIPVLIGGSVGFGAVLGILMLGEVLELQGWAGVCILMAGIAVVATDPGEKVEGH